jgi:hypothetical protein
VRGARFPLGSSFNAGNSLHGRNVPAAMSRVRGRIGRAKFSTDAITSFVGPGIVMFSVRMARTGPLLAVTRLALERRKSSRGSPGHTPSSEMLSVPSRPSRQRARLRFSAEGHPAPINGSATVLAGSDVAPPGGHILAAASVVVILPKGSCAHTRRAAFHRGETHGRARDAVTAYGRRHSSYRVRICLV